MNLEIRTLLVTVLAVHSLALAIFVLTTALRHNHYASRLWGAAFTSAGAFLLCCSIWSNAQINSATTAVMTASLVFTPGIIWAGLRAFDERQSALPVCVATGASGLIATLSLVANLSESHSLIWVTATITSGIFGCVAAYELARSPMAANLNAIILQRTLLLYAALVGVVGTILEVRGESDPARIDTSLTYLLASSIAGLTLICILCLSALRVERTGNWWSSDFEDDASARMVGIPLRRRFESAVNDRLDRMAYLGGTAIVVVAELDELSEINLAFGREVGDDTLLLFARVLRAHVPVMAVIGHLEAGRFAIFSVTENSGHDDSMAAVLQSDQIMSSIRSGLAATPADSSTGMYATASFGCSDTTRVPAEINELIAAAEADLVANRAGTPRN